RPRRHGLRQRQTRRTIRRSTTRRAAPRNRSLTKTNPQVLTIAHVRRLLFELYWRHGADIGNPTVLRTPLVGPMLRGHSGVDPITTDAFRRIRSWRSEWQDLGRPDLPCVQVQDQAFTGLEAVRRLGEEVSGLQSNPELVELPDPSRYPPLSVHPNLTWVSEVGGTWEDTYQQAPLD
ncbi:hypothetical protein, partial [Jatrophihabitans lederbergiae]